MSIDAIARLAPAARRARALQHFVLLLLATACGGGGGPTDNGSPNPPPNQGPPTNVPAATATVAMVAETDPYGAGNAYFSPANVNLLAGGTVTWTNSSGTLHNVTFSAATGAPSDVANIGSGSANRTFPTAGTFAYQCTNHSGMSGSVVVQ